MVDILLVGEEQKQTREKTYKTRVFEWVIR